MSRLARRAEDRRTRNYMTRLGCTCRPSIVPVEPEHMPAGASYGVIVVHQVGCPLGDSMLDLNAAGIAPALVDHRPSPVPCQRTGSGR